MFIRAWTYRVRREHVEEFERAYGAEGDWTLLFAKSNGYQGTRLFRDCGDEDSFLTLDTWLDKREWELFLDRWGHEYYKLDEALSYLTVEEHDLLDEPS